VNMFFFIRWSSERGNVVDDAIDGNIIRKQYIVEEQTVNI
jgi:hypothetical protein